MSSLFMFARIAPCVDVLRFRLLHCLCMIDRADGTSSATSAYPPCRIVCLLLVFLFPMLYLLQHPLPCLL